MTAARSRLPVALLAVLGVLLFCFLGNPTHGYIQSDSLFYWWVYQWINPLSETEHGWMVLALSLYALYRNWKAGSENNAPETTGGLVAVVTGLLLHTAGYVAQQPRVSVVGLLVFVWGVIAIAGGRRWARAAAFPLGFMVFAIPINALDSLGFWLRMSVVSSASGFSHLIGIGVIHSGTELLSPTGRYQYDVAAACSGVRSLMALSALALFVGYLFSERWVLRTALLLLSFPLIFLGNLIRIEGIIVAAQVGGQSWGDTAHEWLGLVVFAFVVVMTALAAEIAVRKWPSLIEGGGKRESGGESRLSLPAAAMIGCGAVAVVAAFLAYRNGQPVSDRAGVLLSSGGIDPVELPAFVGSDWMGKTVDPSAVERSILPPDTGYSRKLYVNLSKPTERVLLSIVLSGRDRSSIHRPELCVVGQGWTIRRSSSTQFHSPGGLIPATVLEVEREVVTPRGPARISSVITYWFVSSQEVVATHSGRLFADAVQRLFHGQADRWAYVLLQTTGTEDIRDSLARMQMILDGSLPAFETVPAVRK